MPHEIVNLNDLGGKDLTNHIKNVKKQELPKYWEKEYINGCIDAIKKPSHKMLMKFLWYSGVRISEAILLRKQDINFAAYTIEIRWLKSRKYHTRNIPMHPELRNIIELYTAGMNQDELIFNITRQRAWQLTKKYMKGHPHQLRHSFAVNWLRSGLDIVNLHRILGHSKIQTTMEYLKIVPNDLGKDLMKVQFR